MGNYCRKQKNIHYQSIKSFKPFDEQITTEKVIFNKTSNIKTPGITFQKEWLSNYKDLITLDIALKTFMDKILIQEGYFSNRNDNSLEQPI